MMSHPVPIRPLPYILLHALFDWKMSVGFGTVWHRGLFLSLALSYIISILIKSLGSEFSFMDKVLPWLAVAGA